MRSRLGPMGAWGRVCLMGAALLAGGRASAELYQAADLSGVTSEDDLRDLAAQGDLEDEELSTLMELLLDPVDINRADRDELYQLPRLTYDLVDALLVVRAEKGPFTSLAGLLDVPGFTPQILAQLQPFAEARPSVLKQVQDELGEPQASLKGRTAYTFGERPRPGYEDELTSVTNDDVLRTQGLNPIPETYLRARAAFSREYFVGLVLLEKAEVADWVYDPDDQVFLIGWGQPVYSVEKAVVAVERLQWSAVAGSYTVGFGQRLVFDNTQRNRPRGWYRDDRINNAVDFQAPERLFGVAGTWKPSPVGAVKLGGTAWGSFRRRDLYQSYFVVDPPPGYEYGALAAGSPPDGYLAGGVELPYVTYPNLYGEAIAGLHGELVLAGKTRFGLTAYGAHLIKYAPIGFTNQLPDRPFFGAVGVDGSGQLGAWNLQGEVAVMDSGGVAAYARSARGWKKGEIVLSGRSYGEDYDNPYSRGSAQPDVYSVTRPDGRFSGDPAYDPELYTSYDRDRDEQGIRLEGFYKLRPRVNLVGYVDPWRSPSTGFWDLDTALRANFTLMQRKLDVDVLGRYQDRVLGVYGHGRSFSGDTPCDPDEADTFGNPCGNVQEGEPEELVAQEATGARITAAAYLTDRHVPNTTLWLNYRRYYEDAAREYLLSDCVSQVYAYQVGHVATLKGTTQLPLDLRTTARVRFWDEDAYGSSGERSVDAYGEVGWWSPDGDWRLSGRYSVTADLRDVADLDVTTCDNGGELPLDPATWPADERTRTPEQTVLATVEYRF